jgi:carbon storage regulator
MLVLTRKAGERIHIGDNIVVTISRIQGDKVRVGIDAPADIEVHREEVLEQIRSGGRYVKCPPAGPEHSATAESPRHSM